MDEIINALSIIPKTLTEKTVEFLSNQGLSVSTRWTSLLFFLISGLLVFIGIKISSPVIKWILIIGGVFLIISLLIPFW